MSDANTALPLITTQAQFSTNLAKLNTPPSLILSPSSTDSPSETTPSALNPTWKAKDKLFDDLNPVDPSSTPSSHSTFDDSAALSQETSAHSRGSSTASSVSAAPKVDRPPRAFASPLGPESAAIGSFSSERPHSFSGGISQSDLRRLQNLPTKGQPPSPISTLERLDGPRTSPPKENTNEAWGDRLAATALTGTPPRYPTLEEQPTAFPSIQNQGDGGQPAFNHAVSPPVPERQPVNLSMDLPARGAGGGQVLYGTTSRSDHAPSRNSRQPISSGYSLAQQQEVQQPYAFPSHNRPAPLDRSIPGYNPQGFYELGSPPPIRRDQQVLGQRIPSSPHSNFAGVQTAVNGDHPTLRNAMSMAMMNNGQGMGPFVGMPSPASGIYTPQTNNASPMGGSFPGFNGQSFYPPTPGYNNPEALSTAMSRMTISSPYNGSAGLRGDPDSSPTQQGPSANNRKLGLYKTELCRSWEEKGSCRYGAKCQFAHSDGEVRKVARHPKYKTEICRTFWVSGSCPYGKRCCFIHTELKPTGSTNNEGTPVGASGGGQNGADPSSMDRNRDRSSSNASGVGSQQGSRMPLLSTQRDSNMINLNSPAETFSPGYTFSNPSGPLRVDTASLSTLKSSRPLTSNPALVASDHHQGGGLSPILPATAGPDFGRQTAARHEVVGYSSTTVNQRGLAGSKTNRDSQLRHSFNGTEIGLTIPSPPPNASGLAAPYSPVTPNPAGSQTPTNNTGHVRSGSAGQWPVGSLGSRTSNAQQLVSPASYLGNNENSSPWGGLPELSIDRKRLSGTWL